MDLKERGGNEVRVFELLTLVGERDFEVEVKHRDNPLTNGKYDQGELSINLLNMEVSDYLVKHSYNTIVIWVK